MEINAIIDNDSDYHFNGLAIFRSSNYVKHIFEETLSCSHDYQKYIAEFLENMAGHSQVLKYYIELYASSSSYNKADWRFDDFDETQVANLIEVSNTNSQIYNRRQAQRANNEIKKRMRELNPNFDFSKYQHFN